MARKKKKAAKKATKKATKKGTRRGKKAPAELIISKSRTKNSVGLRISSDFYAALDVAVREMIAGAEARAAANNRGTLRPHDL
jgi:hypothetical protein